MGWSGQVSKLSCMWGMVWTKSERFGPKKAEITMEKAQKFRLKSRFAWGGSRKNFQYNFFNYLMTNNDVGLSEIVQQFFHGLDFESLLHCRLVCKAWYRFLDQFPSFWMDSLTEVREKFLYEPRNYMTRWRILQCSVQLIIVF